MESRSRIHRSLFTATLAVACLGFGSTSVQAGIPDLTGDWRFDATHSDPPPARDGDGPGARGGAGRTGRGFARPVVLPSLMHITQTSTILSVEDSSGAVVEEITTLGSVADTLTHAPGAAVSKGAWADTALVVERGGQNRISMRRTFTLEQSGKQLVVRTSIATPDGETLREFRRVYRRLGDG